MTTQEVITKVTDRPIYVICATILLCVSIFSVCSCTSICCESMNKADAERAKYRAQQSEAFWKNTQQK